MSEPPRELAQLRYRVAAEYAARARVVEEHAYNVLDTLTRAGAPLTSTAPAGERYRLACLALIAAEQALRLAEAPLRAYLTHHPLPPTR